MKHRGPVNEPRSAICNWPDSVLYRSYARFLTVYEDMVNEVWRTKGHRHVDPCPPAFHRLCRFTVDALSLDSVDARAVLKPNTVAHRSIADTLKEVRIAHGDDWLQSLASILGMLLHLTFRDGGEQRLVNLRRPSKSFSTYPTSPAAVKMLVQDVMSPLLPRPLVPIKDKRGRMLRFALVDPSMESGQLLLGVARFVLDAAFEDCSENPEKVRSAWKCIVRDLS